MRCQRSRTSLNRTGRCGGPGSTLRSSDFKAGRVTGKGALLLLLILLPERFPPDLDLLSETDDHDIPLELAVLSEVLRDEYPPLLVKLDVAGAGEEHPFERSLLNFVF